MTNRKETERESIYKDAMNLGARMRAKYENEANYHLLRQSINKLCEELLDLVLIEIKGEDNANN